MNFFWAYHVLQSWCFSQRAGDGGGEKEAGVDWGEDCCDREESRERERERESEQVQPCRYVGPQFVCPMPAVRYMASHPPMAKARHPLHARHHTEYTQLNRDTLRKLITKTTNHRHPTSLRPFKGKPVSLTNYIHPTPILSLPLVAEPHPSTHPLF